MLIFAKIGKKGTVPRGNRAAKIINQKGISFSVIANSLIQ